MDTIVPATIRQVAQLITALEDRGIGSAEIQGAVDDVVKLNSIATIMLPPVDIGLDLDLEFDKRAMNRLVRYLFAPYFKHQRVMERRRHQFPDDYVWVTGIYPELQLTKTPVMKALMEGLSANHQAVFVLRSGLLDGSAVSAIEVAERLGLDTNQVSRLRKQANEHVKKRVRDLYNFGRWAKGTSISTGHRTLNEASPIEDMMLNPRSYSLLKWARINTVGDLTDKSRDDLLDIRNLGVSQVDQIELILDAAGLYLRQD